MSLTSSSNSLDEASRQEAGPLPSKRGEIGYREDLNVQVEEGNSTNDGDTLPSLPARHPAERDSPPITSSGSPTHTTTDEASSSSISCFKPKKLPMYGGIRLITIMVFTLQLLLLGGTIACWVLAIFFMNKKLGSQQGQVSSFTIFVHIAFIVAVLAQLVFLERRLFRLRAERYCYLHPGEVLPTSLRRTSGTSLTRGLGMGFAPWNRPSLPTYAAALAQNGYGTGDVEDQLIAAPPPPAYGNTRGSTLLLSGFLRDSLRAQRPSSQGSEMSQPNERPISYSSRDGEWEDAERSRRLEETLATLERS